jgi:hypothetical protein
LLDPFPPPGGKGKYRKEPNKKGAFFGDHVVRSGFIWICQP